MIDRPYLDGASGGRPVRVGDARVPAAQGTAHRGLGIASVHAAAMLVGIVFAAVLLAFLTAIDGGTAAADRVIRQADSGGAFHLPSDRPQVLSRAVAAAAFGLRYRVGVVGVVVGGGPDPLAVFGQSSPPPHCLSVAESTSVNAGAIGDVAHRAASGHLTQRMTIGPPRG